MQLKKQETESFNSTLSMSLESGPAALCPTAAVHALLISCLDYGWGIMVDFVLLVWSLSNCFSIFLISFLEGTQLEVAHLGFTGQKYKGVKN